MPRLIDADALIEAIKNELWDWDTLDGITSTTALKQTITDIQNAPTADVVEVVRCRECKHSHPWYADRRTCEMWSETGASVWNDGYCSYGERRDDGTDAS